MKSFVQLETVTHITPLGVACIDIATQTRITTGLRVTATSTTGIARTATAVATPSGAFVLHNLPGLHDFEYESSDETTTSPPITKEFAIQVDDRERRFLPWGMVLTLPRKGLFSSFLFSAPSRLMVPGLAVIRGALKDSTRTGPDGGLLPAAHARIEAQYELTSPPTVYVGMADERGQFALFLPFPNPLSPPPGTTIVSPNTPGRRTLSELAWPVTLMFFYQPARQRFVVTRPDGRVEIIQGQQPGLTDEPPPGWRAVPELPSLLRDQTVARVVRPAASPASAELQIEIEYGKDKVVRAEDGDPTDVSVWIEPQPVSSP